MNIGIIGLPQTGKKTLFKLLVGDSAPDGHADPRSVVRGVADVQDPRFDRLVEIYKPRKEVCARLEVVLLPKIEENVVAEGTIFRDMGEIDAFCQVVRVFDDQSVYHLWGSPDPAREIEFVQSELLLHDQLFVEKRLERIEKDLKKVKDEARQKEHALLSGFRRYLEQEKPLRLLDLSREEELIISSYPFLTRREMIVTLNVSESDIASDDLIRRLREKFSALGVKFVQIAVVTEAEISQLETESERREFMTEMGIADTALHVLTAMCVEAMGLVSFFTTANNEVRQWFVRKGSLAPQAAGAVHTDMQRGFIRAEVMKSEDLARYGSEDKVRAAGSYHVKGKDYVVEDGDILKIRFNV
jgi:GTP-binding protein YchF